MFDSRLFHFMKKEVLQLLRDKRMMFIAIGLPLMQLFLLGYVADMDIKHVSTAVYDDDHTMISREFLNRFSHNTYFDLNYYVDSQQAITKLIDEGKAIIGINIPSKFGQKIAHGDQADVQFYIDGTNAMEATIAMGYISQIVYQAGSQVALQHLMQNGQVPTEEPFDLRLRVWYNGDLESRYFYIPGIFAMILMLISMILTTSSIVKEKTQGTMEMLAVTPLRPMELIMGKLIPFAVVSMLDLVGAFLIAVLWFQVPMRGNVLLLFGEGALFLMAGLGTGLLISTYAGNQRQAGMANLMVTSPQIILSGFVFPIANMPLVIQGITYFIPLSYFLAIVREIFLKGVGMKYLWGETWPMALLGVFLLWLSVRGFKKNLG